MGLWYKPASQYEGQLVSKGAPIVTEPCSDADSIRRFVDGDPVAVARVTGWMRSAVYSRGFRVPHDLRGELVQESLLQLWRNLAERRTNPRSFEALARSIAHRRTIDWIRRRVLGTEELSENVRAEDGLSPEASALEKERVALGKRVLAELRDACRELIHLHSVLGLSFREIAESQGRLEKTVRNQMYKCLDRARRIVLGFERREKLGLRGFKE